LEEPEAKTSGFLGGRRHSLSLIPGMADPSLDLADVCNGVLPHIAVLAIMLPFVTFVQVGKEHRCGCH